MSMLFILLVGLALMFFIVSIHDLCVWYGQRRKKFKDETARWENFHNKFEGDRK